MRESRFFCCKKQKTMRNSREVKFSTLSTFQRCVQRTVSLVFLLKDLDINSVVFACIAENTSMGLRSLESVGCLLGALQQYGNSRDVQFPRKRARIKHVIRPLLLLFQQPNIKWRKKEPGLQEKEQKMGSCCAAVYRYFTGNGRPIASGYFRYLASIAEIPPQLSHTPAEIKKKQILSIKQPPDTTNVEIKPYASRGRKTRRAMPKTNSQDSRVVNSDILHTRNRTALSMPEHCWIAEYRMYLAKYYHMITKENSDTHLLSADPLDDRTLDIHFVPLLRHFTFHTQ